MQLMPLIPLSFLFFVLFPLFVVQLNKLEMKTRLSRFIAEDPVDVALPREEAVRLSTEAFRLWAVAAAYGQACDLYRYSSELETWGGGHSRVTGHPGPEGPIEGSPGSASVPFRVSYLTFSGLLQ